MDRIFGRAHFTSHKVRDGQDGGEGHDLTRYMDGESSRVANVMYWDATGHYWVETFGSEVPLEILEKVIAETKEYVGIR